MEYPLVNAIYAALIAFVINLFLCPLLIPYLARLKFGQYVRNDGPQTHLKKSGTPTMGGIIILITFLIAASFFVGGNKDVLALLGVTLGCGTIGFLDDFIKSKKKRSLGLRAYQKIIGQLVVVAAFSIYAAGSAGIGTEFLIPFTNGATVDLGIFYVPIVMFIMIGTINGANLTDGLDGLAAGVTLLITIFFLFSAWVVGNPVTAVAGAAAGALLGFLLFNSHPAKVFMGDTGSLALGGLVACVAIILKMPLFLPIVAFIYVIEVLSVTIQVMYFKKTHKRFFRMAPIHHHFELIGYTESKVVSLFYIATAFLCLVGFLGAKYLF